MLLHASSFAQRFFYTQGLLHRRTLTYTDKSCTHKYFCTAMFFKIQVFSHTCTRACSFTEMSLNAHASTQRYSHTQILLRRDFPARRCFHTQKRFHAHIFLHRDIRDEFTLRNFAHTDAITNRGASTKETFT